MKKNMLFVMGSIDAVYANSKEKTSAFILKSRKKSKKPFWVIEAKIEVDPEDGQQPGFNVLANLNWQEMWELTVGEKVRVVTDEVSLYLSRKVKKGEIQTVGEIMLQTEKEKAVACNDIVVLKKIGDLFFFYHRGKPFFPKKKIVEKMLAAPLKTFGQKIKIYDEKKKIILVNKCPS